MKTRILRALVALILAASPVRPAAAQSNGGYTKRVVTLYDYSSATETFCALDPGEGSQGPGPVTAAASNTVTGSSVFGNVAVGDELTISQNNASYVVGVEARASSSSITAAYRDPTSATMASTTLTFTNAIFKARTLRCGTGANSGAFSVGYGPVTVHVTVFRMAATGILWRLQCRSSQSDGWNQIYPELTPPSTTASYITAASASPLGYTVSTIDPFAECRVGITVDTDAGVQAVSVSASGRLQ